MNRTALLGTVAVFALVVPAAIGAPPAGKGKPPATGPGCKPQVALIAKGDAKADATTTQVQVKVTGGNSFAGPLFANNTTTDVTVTVASSTKITSGGAPAALTSIKSGERVLVQYKVCKADLKGKNASALATFLASQTPKKVVDQGTPS